MSAVSTKKTNKRGAYTRAECVFIGAWFPAIIAQAIDQLVKSNDSDRSKILRRAVAEKLKDSEVA
jgi:metal-responsive CopG/Arc/MetJ family transcriptional regulator